MKRIPNAQWPPEMLAYSQGITNNVARAKSSFEPGHNDGYVSVGSLDLQFCAPCEPVKSYKELRRIVARLATLNPQYELYFRGQSEPYFKGGKKGTAYFGHSLLPSLWRNQEELSARLDVLALCEEKLVGEYATYDGRDISTLEMLLRSRPACWALLQHYELCRTPLLDLTRTLQIACSFALASSSDEKKGYIYVLGLPFQREKVMTMQDEGILCMSLLGVTPSNADRPLVQDGYLVCDSDWWRLVGSSGDDWLLYRRECDLASRILAVLKVAYPDDGDFWTDEFMRGLPPKSLYPRSDRFDGEFLSTCKLYDYAVREHKQRGLKAPSPIKVDEGLDGR